MNTGRNDHSLAGIENWLQPGVVRTHEAANILSRAGDALVRNQLTLGVLKFPEDLPDVASFMSPQGPARMLWQLPAIYQTQARHMAQVMLDSIAVLARAQQQLLELGQPSLPVDPQKATSGEVAAAPRQTPTAQLITLANHRGAQRPGQRRSPAQAQSRRKPSRGEDRSSATA